VLKIPENGSVVPACHRNDSHRGWNYFRNLTSKQSEWFSVARNEVHAFIRGRYVRTIRRESKDGSVVESVPLAHNEWDQEKGLTRPKRSIHLAPGKTLISMPSGDLSKASAGFFHQKTPLRANSFSIILQTFALSAQWCYLFPVMSPTWVRVRENLSINSGRSG